MAAESVVLDTDTLSELSRGNTAVRNRAFGYLRDFGRLTITSITVFERRRGYRLAIRDRKPFERQLHAFEELVANCIVLPFDQASAVVAAEIWAASSRSQRQKLGDILIAAIALSRQMALVTRNRRDFEGFNKVSGTTLRLEDWTRPKR